MRNFLQNLKNGLTSIKSGHRSDSILSRFCLVSLILMTVGIGQVWGWSTSGSAVKEKDGVYYVLYETGESNFSTIDSKEYTINGPGAQLYYDAKCVPIKVVFEYWGGDLRVAQLLNNSWSSQLYGATPPKNSYKSYGPINLDKDATKVKLYTTTGATGKKYFNNVKVTMAQYVNAPSATSLAFGEADVNSTATSKTVTVAWCNVPAMTYTITGANASLFEVSSISNNSEAGKWNTATFTVKYKHTTAGTHTATLTIKDSYGNYSKTVSLSGTTNKLQPTVTWSSNDDIFNVDDELSATNSNDLAVTLSSTGNESFVSCSGNTATMLAATSGTITINAHVAGNEIYADKDFQKEITITSLEKQHITWTQDLSRLKTTDATKSVTLNATASSGLPVTYELQGDKTGLTLTQNGSVWTLTYTASECKNTTIIAHQGGNSTYAPASSVSMPVKVIDPTKVCDRDEILVNSSITLKSSSVTYNIDIPESMKISLSRVKTGFGLSNVYLNGVDVEFYSGRNGTGTKLYTKSYEPSDISNSISNASIDLADYINAKSVKVVTDATNGYYLTSLTYRKRKYCNINPGSLSFETYPNTTTSAKTFTVNYANYPISLECSNNKFSFTPAEFGDCSEYGSQTISVTYTAGADEGSDNGYIYIKDNTGVTLQTCTLSVSITKLSQSITTHNIQTAYKTTDRITLTAETNSAATEKHFTYSANPTGVALFANNVMTFSQSGTIAITVTEGGSNIYRSCSETVNNVVVSKVTPDIVSVPAGTAMTYLQTLSASTLSGGSADVTLRGIEHTTVAGSFVWTEPTHQVTDAAGSHSYGVTFNPTDGGMYNPNTTGSVTITVNKAAQAITMNNGTVKVAVEGIDAGKADSYLDLSTLIASQTSDPVNNNRVGAVTYEVISANKNKATINGLTFSATVCDTYTVRATKAATAYYNEATYDFTVTVGKRANTLVVVGAQTKFVDDEIADVATVVNSDGEIHTTSTDATIAYYDVATNKIIIPNSEAKSFNDTTVTITIVQDATARFEASDEKKITVTVKKYDNAFACSWNSFEKTVNFDEVVAAQFTTQNTDYAHYAIDITQTSGPKIAKLVRNDDTNNTITASYSIGKATWHLTQAESYKYKAALADVTLNVQTLDGENCYMFEDNSEHEFKTKITDGSGHFDTPIPVSGPVNKLYFEAKRDFAAISQFIVQYSVDNGSNWREIAKPDLSIFYESFGPYEFPNLAADERVTHIRFGATVGGTLSKYYKNIKITRTTNIKPFDEKGNLINSLTMPQSTVDGSTTAKFYLNYSSCDDTIKIVSDDAHFSVDIQEIAVDHTKDFNNAEITVTYSSTTRNTHTGTITIYTKYQHETLTVTGETVKKTQTLTWEDGFKANPLSLQVGLVVDNVNYAATVSSEHAVYYESDDESVIKITDGGLGFEIVGEGTATLTAKDNGDDDWFPVSDTKTINATYKQIQEIVWTQDFIRNMELGMEKPLEAQVCIRNLKTGELTYNAARTSLITYSCPANSVISLDNEAKKITIIGYGNTTITASMPTGDENFEDAHPVTLIVKVRQPSEGCETPYVLDQASTIELFSDDVLGGNAFNFSDWTTTELTSDPILLDPANGKPDKMSYQHDAEEYSRKVGLSTLRLCSGKVIAQQRIGGTWYDIAGSEYEQKATLTEWNAGAYTWKEVRDLQLDENADAIRFKREAGGTGHHKFKDIQINLKHYLRPTIDTVELGDITIGEDRPIKIGIEYSDTQKDLRADEGNEADMVVTEPNIRIDCGTFGHYDVLATIHPTELGPWSNSIIVTDKATSEQITIIINANVIPEFMHTYETEGQWGEQTHWKDDKKPTYKDDVRIAADVEVVSDITVNSITIEEGATVTVNPGVTLTLRGGTTRLRTTYGNLHVKDGGKVVVGTGVLMINDFILDAALGNADNAASSGQVVDDNEVKKFVVKGDAYFDLALDPSRECSQGWYDFTVPFEVDALHGITRFDNTTGEEKAITNEVNYAIMDYSESRRLENGYGWKKFRGIMQPGKCYTITIDDVDNVYRFKKMEGGSFYNQESDTLAYTESEDANRGWNGLGNGTLAHVDLNAAGIEKVQIYSHKDNSFTAVDIDEYTYVVGSAYFIQAPTSKSAVTYTAGTSDILRAPRRIAANTNSEFRLSLVNEQTSMQVDRLYVGASEEALDSYEIGRDLAKCGTPTESKVAQVWVNAYGMKLCDIDMPLINEEASCSISLYAPKAGVYTLDIERAPEDAALYLTYNDQVIWDLTMSAYEFELSKGLTDGYGLKMVSHAPKVATGVDNADAESAAMRKVIINDKVYVITPEGKMYDVIGKCVKY